MICERCGTQFEGRNCPNCDAPAEKTPVRPERKISAKPFLIAISALAGLCLVTSITLGISLYREMMRGENIADPPATEAQASSPSDAQEVLASTAPESPGTAAPADSLTDSEAALQWKQKSGIYPDGDYAVGKDIPAGEYIILSDGIGYGDFYTGVYASPSMSDESEIWFAWQQGNCYIVLEEGQYLHFSHATLYDPEMVDIVLDPSAGSGMYKCGRDFAPGTYRIVPTNDQYGAEYTVYSALTSSGGIAIQSSYSDDVTADPVTLTEGQYISLRFAKLEAQ